MSTMTVESVPTAPRMKAADRRELILEAATAVFGATTLTILPEALRGLDQQYPGLRMVVYALLLILMMIFRPQGLFGAKA